MEGDIPWYVQFRVSKGSIADAANFDLGELLGSYEMSLWNLLDDSPYSLNGRSVTVTVPVKNAADYEKVSVLHYFSDGSYEELYPEILGNAIRFTTSSFSPYTISGQAAGYIAGSQVIVGPGMRFTIIIQRQAEALLEIILPAARTAVREAGTAPLELPAVIHRKVLHRK